MKNNSTLRIFRRTMFSFGLFTFLGSSVMAQPANDDCASAIAIPFAVDSAACAPTAATSIGATGSTDPVDVCSASWFDDDVWFSFTTPAVMPTRVVVQTYFDDAVTATDIINVGMAVYAGCGTGEIAIRCFSGGDDAIVMPDLMANTTYYVRVWSANTSTPNGGTFEICAFGDNSPCTFGTLNTAGPIWHCPGDIAEINNTGNMIPQFGGFGYEFSPGTNAGGGVAAGFTLTNADEIYTFDEDLNGVMSGNGLGVLTGQWFITPVVYYDDESPLSTVCDSASAIEVVFLSAADPVCDGVGIPENGAVGDIELFPNPSNGLLTLSSSEINSLDRLSVLSADGKLIMDLGIANFTSGKFDIDLTHLEDGVYFMQFNQEGRQAMRKFVLTR